MNHETLGLVVKFVIRARKVVGPIEATRLAEDLEYRDEIFNKIAAEGSLSLNELALIVRDKLELEEPVASSRAYKNVPIDFKSYEKPTFK